MKAQGVQIKFLPKSSQIVGNLNLQNQNIGFQKFLLFWIPTIISKDWKPKLQMACVSAIHSHTKTVCFIHKWKGDI